jgi:hypothetical protein
MSQGGQVLVKRCPGAETRQVLQQWTQLIRKSQAGAFERGDLYAWQDLFGIGCHFSSPMNR